jgi:GNAT superfamily N-acetyltransferase
MVPHLRRATAHDTDAIVRILIASKEASFPETIDAHDRDVPFWTDRWRRYITKGSRAQQSLGDGWVFIAELGGMPVGYVAYHHTRRHGTDAELQNIYVLKEAQGQGIGTHLLGVVAHSSARGRLAQHVRRLRRRQPVQAFLHEARRCRRPPGLAVGCLARSGGPGRAAAPPGGRVAGRAS